MLSYNQYDRKVHRLFESAYNIRCNPNSTVNELLKADDAIDNALKLADEMEKRTGDLAISYKIITGRLRCYIERLAIFTRLLKNAYGTPSFDALSRKHEVYCNLYMHIYSHIRNDEVQQSLHQLTVMACQSLAAGYFRRGGMGKDKTLCLQAIGYLDKAMELTVGEKLYDILQANKQQILQAIGE